MKPLPRGTERSVNLFGFSSKIRDLARKTVTSLGMLEAFGSFVVVLGAFLWWTWPSRLPDSVPGPGKDVPYLGALLTVLYNFERLPDYCVEMLQLYGGKTWAGPMPRIGMMQGAVFFVTTPEVIFYVYLNAFVNLCESFHFRPRA